jgi:hypothetical protein
VLLCPDVIRNHFYAANESFVDMHLFEYSTMDPRNSFSEAFITPVRSKNSESDNNNTSLHHDITLWD